MCVPLAARQNASISEARNATGTQVKVVKMESMWARQAGHVDIFVAHVEHTMRCPHGTKAAVGGFFRHSTHWSDFSSRLLDSRVMPSASRWRRRSRVCSAHTSRCESKTVGCTQCSQCLHLYCLPADATAMTPRFGPRQIGHSDSEPAQIPHSTMCPQGTTACVTGRSMQTTQGSPSKSSVDGGWGTGGGAGAVIFLRCCTRHVSSWPSSSAGETSWLQYRHRLSRRLSSCLVTDGGTARAAVSGRCCSSASSQQHEQTPPIAGCTQSTLECNLARPPASS